MVRHKQAKRGKVMEMWRWVTLKWQLEGEINEKAVKFHPSSSFLRLL